MNNGLRILGNLSSSQCAQRFECKDYPVWDGDRWNESWSHNSWGDSHGN